MNYDWLELEKLLINCQQLNGLVVVNYKYSWEDKVNYDSLFKILDNSSPTSLFMFKFKIYSLAAFKLESLKLFLDNWKNRHFMLLQTNQYNYFVILDWRNYWNLIEKYKTLGIVKKYNHYCF